MNIHWEDKIWGKTREIVDSPFYSKHQLDVVAGGFCSLHYHQHRANRFLVESARIVVVLFFGPKMEKYDLGPDNMLDVPSFVPHLFMVYSSGIVFEEYYPDRGGVVRNNDIVRLHEGGWKDIDHIDLVPSEIFHRLLG